MPPELAGLQGEFESQGEGWGEGSEEIRRLHRRHLESSQPDPVTDRLLVEYVLERARRVMTHPSRPRLFENLPFTDYPSGEIDLESSLDNDPTLTEAMSLRVEISREKSLRCVAMLDLSSSMSGDKHWLASIAVAVLLLEIPEASALVTFASDATVVKPYGSKYTIEENVLRFLKTRPRGFTNIAAGLQLGLSQTGRSKRITGLLCTDGRTTEGDDPLEIAKRFDLLLVLHLHGSGSELSASKEIANRGRGFCLEVERFQDLPKKMYEAIRILGRL